MPPLVAQTASSPVRLDSEAAANRVATRLLELFESVELYGTGENASTIADLTTISRELIKACDSLRQYDKQRAKSIESIPLPDIIRHLRSLPLKQRADIAREVSGETDGEGLFDDAL